MRIYFLGAALAFALALPDPALAQSGHADLSYTSHEYDFGGFGTDVDGATLGGQVAFDTGPVGVQIDARYAQRETDVNDLDVFGLGAHVFTRNDRWLFGGYVGHECGRSSCSSIRPRAPDRSKIAHAGRQVTQALLRSPGPEAALRGSSAG